VNVVTITEISKQPTEELSLSIAIILVSTYTRTLRWKKSVTAEFQITGYELNRVQKDYKET